MHLRTRLVAAFLAAIVCGLTLSAQAPDEPRLVLISIDGLMPVSYTGPGDSAPTLRGLAHQGAWADGVIGVTPSVTYPSHTTLVTGVEPARHGIYDNRIFDPEGRSNGAWYYYARDIQVPTVATAARARGLRTASINWPVSVGLGVDYLFPEYYRTPHPDNLSLLRVLSVPQTLLDAVEVSRGEPLAWPMGDRERTDIAIFVLKTFDPHFLQLHLIDLDGTQHDFGPGTPEAAETLAHVDALVGEIVAAVAASGHADRTTIAVVSDHGFERLETQVQPNAVLKREGLITVNGAGRVTDWQAYFQSSGGSGYVHVKDPAQEARVGRLLQAMQQDPANGIQALWTRGDLAARGAHPDAAFGIAFADGFYSSEAHDVVRKPSATRGGHGFDPLRPALRASFVIAGPAVSARGSLGVIRMTRIGPTLASILGVQLAPDADDPLDVLGAGRTLSPPHDVLPRD